MHGSLETSPLLTYRARLEDGLIKADTMQALAVEKLESLHHALAAYAPETGRAGWKARFGLARRTRAEPPQGLYIYGGVGRGKSMLMDMFFRTAPVAAKRRVHFHAFMQEIQARLKAHRQNGNGNGSADARRRRNGQGGGDVIEAIGREIAADAWLLCFDELQVLDIADAMILGRLFEVLFDAGVVIVATSNRPPRDLYKDGLQRELFLPFIDLIGRRLDVLELESGIDYRLQAMRAMDVFLTPLSDETDARLDLYFEQLTKDRALQSETLTVHGRALTFEHVCDDVAFATFEELCERPLGPADYLAIAERFDVLVLSRIPYMPPVRRNEAKRFVTLIDALYEHKVKLICSAARAAEDLYPGGDGAFEFDRTVSRLMEMRSDIYLGARHIG